jgi:CSLREA domain-containing protein
MLHFYPRLFIAAFFLVSAFTVSVSAAVLTVTTLADTDDSVCDANCSFRDAIAAAAPGDTIIFARDLRGGTIQLVRTLTVNKFIKVDGPNRRRITLKGDETFRIIESHGNLWIDGLIIRDGNAGAGDGGGILATGTLNLTNVGIVNNSAQHGGGIFITGGTLILADSLVAGNTASGDGAGGGVDAYLHTFVRINNSTISGNASLSTGDGAGGVRLYDPEPGGSLLVSSTIAFNTSNGTSITSAGGIAILGIPPGQVINTILAKNTGVNNPDHYKGFGAINCLIGITYPTSGITNGVNGNIVGSAAAPAEPLLAPLSDNGGLQTHALLTGSPAIDSGNNDRAEDRLGNPLLVDQRGFVRVINSIVDMGSYELGSQPLVRTSEIQGRVVTASGLGISGAHVELRDAGGNTRHAITNPFGFFRFVDVIADQSYSLICSGKRSAFPEQTVLIEETTEYINFVASN